LDKLVGATVGQYRIVEQIGIGGMATVFKAYQPALDRYVAIKVLPAQHALTPGFSERFIREAKAVAQLNHPNILPIYDFGQEADLSYIVSKYVSAGTLKERLTQPLSLQQAARLIEQLAGALDHAHERGILHRDVKPSNVLVDEGEWALLTDFGLAKMIAGESDLTGSGVGVGTPAYMSPEQIMGAEIDHRSDIYALGIILYEMVTGRVPYEAETPMAIVLMHVQQDPTLPRLANPDLPEAVERIILKAMAKKPDERFQSAGEMAQALKRAAEEATQAALPLPRVGASAPAPLPSTPAPSPEKRPEDWKTQVRQPVPGLPVTIPLWIILALAAIGFLALIRVFLGGGVMLILLVIAVWVIPYWVRPRQVGPNTQVTQHPFGDLRRTGDWPVVNEEMWFFAGNVNLDLRQARMYAGETRIRVFGFAGSVTISVPENVGVVASLGVVFTDSHILGQEHKGVLSPLTRRSLNYESAERRLRVDVRLFAGNVKIRQENAG
jgi:predicted membrane protein